MTLASLASALDASLLGMRAGGAVEGGVEVDFDYTLVIQVGLFIILLLVLKPMLFDPMLKLFEERERRIEGAKLVSVGIDKKSQDALTKYETEMAAARGVANAEREKLRAEGVKAENELLAKVRATTSQALDEGKAKAQAEASRVRATLKVDAQGLAKDLAARVLGREVQG